VGLKFSGYGLGSGDNGTYYPLQDTTGGMKTYLDVGSTPIPITGKYDYKGTLVNPGMILSGDNPQGFSWTRRRILIKK